MKRHYYLFTDGTLKRKDHSLIFQQVDENKCTSIETCLPVQDGEDVSINISDQSETEKKKPIYIPIGSVESIFCFSETQFTRAVLSHLGKTNIPVFIFDFYGNYAGSYIPREETWNGKKIIEQVRHYLDARLRLVIAREITSASIKNMDSTLAYYDNRGINLVAERVQIQNMLEDANGATAIKRLLGAEGYARKNYYKGWSKILSPVTFTERSSNPPGDPVNALVSFLYALLYSVCASECYRVGLNPAVSYVHEPGERRCSLCLDIADIFKPLLCDRLVFTLINTKIIDIKKHTKQEAGGYYLNEDGRKLVVKKFDDKIRTTFQHRRLGRSISYRQLIQHEFHKLLSHIMEGKKLQCFNAWW